MNLSTRHWKAGLYIAAVVAAAWLWFWILKHYHPVSAERTSWNTMVASGLSEIWSVIDLKSAVKKS